MNQALVLRILYFLVFCCTASWLPLMADYCKHRHLSGSQTGILLAITPLFMFLVQPVYGIIADKFGYKKTIIYASFFAAICYLGYLYDIGYNGLIVITILMSVFYNTIQPILDSLSLQYSVANPSFSYGSLRVMGAMGWAFTGIVTGQIIDKININWIFGVSAISMFLFVVFSLFLKRTKNENQTYSNDFSANNLGILLKNKQLLFLLLAVCVVSLSGSTIWYFYSTYLKQIGATATLVGFGLSFQGICELPFFYFSARIILKFGLKTTLIITLIALVIRLSLYSVITNPFLTLPVELLHGVSWSLFWVVCVESVNKLVKNEWLATGQSLLYVAYYGVGTILGNYWTGYLSDAHYPISKIFLLNAGLVIMVIVFLWFCFKKMTKSANAF